MRHSATRALFERDDVVIVASVSCIYGIGSPEVYARMTLTLQKGAARSSASACCGPWSSSSTSATTLAFTRGAFRVRGDTIEIFPAHLEDRAWRVSMFGDEVEPIAEFDPLTGERMAKLDQITALPNSHYVTPKPTLQQAVESIKEELKQRLEVLPHQGQAARGRAARAAHHRRPRDDRSRPAPARASRTTRATSPAGSRASRRRRCSSTCPRTRSSSSTRATSPCRRSAACTGATSSARARSPSSASACPPAATTARSSSRSGTRCGRRRSTSRPRPAAGSSSAPAASSSSR